LALAISKELGTNPELKFTGHVRAGEPDNWEFDIQKLGSTGFHSKFSLQDGISQTSAWFMTQYDKN